MTRKKILFVQHASGLGGSAMSLLYTIEALRTNYPGRFEMVVALAKRSDDVSQLYRSKGISVINPDERIDTYEHTQAVTFNLLNPAHLLREFVQNIQIQRAKKVTQKLIRVTRPDIVHLNSIVLLGSAKATHAEGVPLVWHVRETASRGLLGLRYRRLRNALRRYPSKTIFICHTDFESWGAPKNGVIIYNFVNERTFNRSLPGIQSIDDRCLRRPAFVILFLGGVSRIKGGLILLRAFKHLVKRNKTKRIILVLPGTINPIPSQRLTRIARWLLPKFGYGTYAQRIERELSDPLIADHIVKLRFVTDVASLIAKADVLVFPSIRPHFARPVVEAGMMAVPVIVSDLDSNKELVDDGINGLVFQNGNSEDLTRVMKLLLDSKDLVHEYGQNNYRIALKRYNGKTNIESLARVYDGLD